MNNLNSFLQQDDGGYGQINNFIPSANTMSVVERTKLWAEYKEKSITHNIYIYSFRD